MSVQLTVYPQWYNGVVNPITAVGTNQMLSDPQNFTSVGSGTYITAPNAQTAQFGVNHLFSSMTTNTWYGIVNNSVGALTGGFGTCTYYPGYECILQKINGLVQGGLYDGRITWNPVMTPQAVMVKIFNGTTLVTNITATPTANDDATFQFTAPSTNDTIIVIDYDNTVNPITLSSVSVKEAPVQPTQPIGLPNNGSVICDLYEDEDIPLTLSVDNFKNAAEQVQSYSKAFNLPATKRNNQIFDNIFEITRNVDSNSILFNPYRKTKAVLKQDGFLIFEGYLRMLDISEKDGEISYNVNLYAEVTALADTLGERTFSDLDFSELEHDYNISNITDSWDGVLPVAALPISSFANNTGVAGATTTNVLKYPNVDWNHQVSVDTSGNPVLSNLECAFRPFIKLKYCIDMIFSAPSTPFSYTSSFFNGAEFGNLYMDFNWGSGNAPVVFNSSAIVFRNSPQALTTSFATLDFTSSSPATLGSEFGYSSGVFTAQTDNQFYNISFDIKFILAGLTSPPEQMTIQWLVNGVSTDLQVSPFMTTTSGAWGYQGVFSATLSSGDTILCQAKSTSTNLQMVGGQNLISVITSSDQTTTSTLLQTLRGELGQWDFLKGIMTMFNLVTMPDPDNPNNLLIEPYADVFITPKVGANLASRGVEYDWTEKVDISEMKLNPLTDLSLKTIFKFVEDDDDFCFNEYKRQVSGHLYGSLTYSAVEFNILTGTEEVVAEPFGATVIKQLESQYSDFIIPAIYAKGDDGECTGFDNSPRIMYNDGKKTLTSCTYYVPAQNGIGDLYASNILQFSHLSAIPTIVGSTVDYNFGQCQLVNGVTPVAPNLFNRFWLPYYSQLYNPNTRTMTMKVNLNAGDINRFKFNDKVFIKNRIFRVNKIDYKPNDLATVEFILIE
jgi:hypothetical protein